MVRGYFHGEVDSKYGASASPVLKYDAKRLWTTEEESILKSAFADKIMERNIKIEDVRQRYFSLNIKDVSEKQLYDKVRNLIGKEQTDIVESEHLDDDSKSQEV